MPLPSVMTQSKIDTSQLDLEYRCMFREQLADMCRGLKYGTGEEVEVPMRSGKVAIYKVTSERYNYVFEDTGQRNWLFKFIRYKE